MIRALILASCLVLQPATDEKPELKEKVEQLIRQLDDNELAKREDAEKQLVTLGSQVLPLLPKANNSMPAEMRQRLARITSALEKVASVSSVEASKVTLSGELTLKEALEKITEQTGNAMTGYEDTEAKVTADLQDVPFWTALDQILDQAKLTSDPLGGQPNTLVLAARPPEQVARVGSGFYQGPFRVEAIRIFSLRDLRLDATSSMRVAMNIAWEPRLAPISVTHPFASVKAVDDQGNSITVGEDRGGWDATIHPGMTGLDIEIPLQLAPRTANKIATLSGEFQVLVPGEAEEFVFKGSIKGRETHGGVTVFVENVRPNGELQQISVRVRFEEGEGALESHLGWILNNEAYLLDPKGERIDSAGLQSTGQRGNDVGVAYLFDRPEGLKDCQFVYKTPTTIVRQSIQYELKDLPLP